MLFLKQDEDKVSIQGGAPSGPAKPVPRVPANKLGEGCALRGDDFPASSAVVEKGAMPVNGKPLGGGR